MVNPPVEWIIGVIRTLRVSVDTPKRVQMVDSTLKTLGQRPFYPPSVGGWPRGRAWLSTASAGVRLRATGDDAGRWVSQFRIASRLPEGHPLSTICLVGPYG
jgi:uncharacterized protein (DUF1800 family)